MPRLARKGRIERFFGRELSWALGFVAPYRLRLAVVLGFSLLGTGVALTLPYLGKLLVDDALVGGSMRALVQIVAAFFGFTLLTFVLNVGGGIQYARVSADVLFDMRLTLYRHLQRLSPAYFARTPLGDIVSRINNDIGEIQRVVSDSALAWIGHVAFLVGAVSVMVWLDLRLFLVAVALLPLSVVALIYYRRRLESSIATMRVRSAEIGSFLIETLQAGRLVAASNAQEREAARFRTRNDAFVESMLKMQWLRYLSGGLPGIILAGSTCLVFLYGGARVIDGSLTLGTFVAFMAYQMRLLGPVQGIMGLYASVATVRVSLRRVHEVLDAPIDVSEPQHPVVPGPARGEVRFHGVQFSFGRGEPVLDGVDLTILAGERIALVGASGSGKSTIGDLLVRHLDPLGGRIVLDGIDLRELSLQMLRTRIVTVEQEPFLFHATLADNVRYARPQATIAQIEDALLAAGLGELLGRLPAGLQTLVGERGRALSVGERQRVALARALLMDPAVVVLDEPSAALDPRAEETLVAGCRRAFAGRTLVMISHRLELARQADRAVVLQGGRIVQQGPPEVLLRDPGAFRQLMRSTEAPALSASAHA
ncbi:MAG: ABC transporter ATP-binding protein [Gemmatimonadota bacterium]